MIRIDKRVRTLVEISKNHTASWTELILYCSAEAKKKTRSFIVK